MANSTLEHDGRIVFGEGGSAPISSRGVENLKTRPAWGVARLGSLRLLGQLWGSVITSLPHDVAREEFKRRLATSRSIVWQASYEQTVSLAEARRIALAILADAEARRLREVQAELRAEQLLELFE